MQCRANRDWWHRAACRTKAPLPPAPSSGRTAEPRNSFNGAKRPSLRNRNEATITSDTREAAIWRSSGLEHRSGPRSRPAPSGSAPRCAPRPAPPSPRPSSAARPGRPPAIRARQPKLLRQLWRSLCRAGRSGAVLPRGTRAGLRPLPHGGAAGRLGAPRGRGRVRCLDGRKGSTGSGRPQRANTARPAPRFLFPHLSHSFAKRWREKTLTWSCRLTQDVTTLCYSFACNYPVNEPGCREPHEHQQRPHSNLPGTTSTEQHSAATHSSPCEHRTERPAARRAQRAKSFRRAKRGKEIFHLCRETQRKRTKHPWLNKTFCDWIWLPLYNINANGLSYSFAYKLLVHSIGRKWHLRKQTQKARCKEKQVEEQQNQQHTHNHQFPMSDGEVGQ